MTATAPADARSLLKQAMDHHQAGRLAEAEQGYLQVADAGYRKAEVMGLLAGIAEDDGRLELALTRWQDVLEASPSDLQALVSAGRLLHRLGRTGEAADVMVAASTVAPNDPYVVANLGVALFDAGRRDEALKAFRQAAERWPNSPMVQHQTRRVAAASVPFWHIPMMNDHPRNAAFESAVIQAIRARGPGARILDIGAGSGLLSMMAARAGATGVVACEAEPVIAETARTIVESNGYADRVRIVSKRSTDLVVGKDIDEPADILISEILSSDLLTEDILKTFEDALTRLVKPDATIIPYAVTAVGCLAGGEVLEHQAFVDTVEGFDVSPFGLLAPQRLPVAGNSPPWTRLSEDTDLLHIDLKAPAHPATLSRLAVTASSIAPAATATAGSTGATGG